MGTRALIFYCAIILLLEKGLAAPCCGGGAGGGGGGVPLITGDDSAQLSFSVSNSALTHRANDKRAVVGHNLSSNAEVGPNILESMAIGGAYLVSPYWQLGASFPFNVQTFKAEDQKKQSRGFSEIAFQVAYEFMPDYFYNRWKPRGFLVLAHLFRPTPSFSPFKKNLSPNEISSTNLAFIFIKRISQAQIGLRASLVRGWKRQFATTFGQYGIQPGLTQSLDLSLGFSLFDTGLGIESYLHHSRQGKGKFIGDLEGVLPSRDWTEIGLKVNYRRDFYSLSLAYRDQTLLRYAKNTILSRGILFSYNYFFPL